MEKKSLRFGMVSDVDQKNNQVFWRGKISLEAIDFLPLKVLYILFCTRRSSNPQNFFSSQQPSTRKIF